MTGSIRDRIVDLERVRGSDILEHPDQFRFHPRAERDALRGIVEEIGIADVLVAYRSERAAGALVLINGHMRVSEVPDAEWPVVVVDLDDQEADIMIASMDAMSGMGSIGDPGKHAVLLERIKAKAPGLQSMLRVQRARGKIAELLAQARGDLDSPINETGSGQDARGEGLASARVRVRPVIWIEDLATFERAIRATRLPNRGDAVATIMRFYLENVKDRHSASGTDDGQRAE